MKIRTDAVTWREVGDEVVVLDERTWEYLQLNGTAAALWRRLSEDATPDDLVAVITGEWDAAPEVAREDVDAFTADLRSRDLLERGS